MRVSPRTGHTIVAAAVATWMLMAVLPPSAHGREPGKPVPMGSETRKQLDTFFSAFAQARVLPFAAGKMSDQALIDFGVRHTSNRAQGPATREGVPVGKVDEVCRQFFGTSPKHHRSTSTYPYKNGRYQVVAASGEVFMFSQASELRDRGDGSLAATVTVYAASSGFTGDVHGKPAEWKAAGDDVKQTARMKAIIRKISHGGASHYVLVEYGPLQ